MASTFRPSDAFDYAKRQIKGMPLEQIQLRVLSVPLNMLWMAAPWRWTLGAMPNITLAATTQSYVIALPSDFLFAVMATQTDQAGGNPRPIEIVPQILTGGLQGMPNQVAFSGTAGMNGTALVTPTPGILPVPQYIISFYKRQCPVLTPRNIFTKGVQIFDDEYFHVYESGVLWAAYLYGDDQRAGTANTDANGRYTFTGQRAIFEANLEWMRQREPLLLDDPRQQPDVKKAGR